MSLKEEYINLLLEQDDMTDLERLLTSRFINRGGPAPYPDEPTTEVLELAYQSADNKNLWQSALFNILQQFANVDNWKDKLDNNQEERAKWLAAANFAYSIKWDDFDSKQQFFNLINTWLDYVITYFDYFSVHQADSRFDPSYWLHDTDPILLCFKLYRLFPEQIEHTKLEVLWNKVLDNSNQHNEPIVNGKRAWQLVRVTLLSTKSIASTDPFINLYAKNCIAFFNLQKQLNFALGNLHLLYFQLEVSLKSLGKSEKFIEDYFVTLFTQCAKYIRYYKDKKDFLDIFEYYKDKYHKITHPYNDLYSDFIFSSHNNGMQNTISDNNKDLQKIRELLCQSYVPQYNSYAHAA